eukprot:scaffold43542_cov17-Tisochrysis_lutea.AAC.3
MHARLYAQYTERQKTTLIQLHTPRHNITQACTHTIQRRLLLKLKSTCSSKRDNGAKQCRGKRTNGPSTMHDATAGKGDSPVFSMNFWEP